jgi:hypothetical protein
MVASMSDYVMIVKKETVVQAKHDPVNLHDLTFGSVNLR